MNVIWITALSLGGVVYIGFILTALRGILHLRKIKPVASPDDRRTDRFPSVSVILAARNEQDEIGSTLDSLALQDYPNFEIIVIDDRSSDRTSEITCAYIERDTRIRLIQQTVILPGWSPKKAALNKGIEAAAGEIIAATDADCRCHPGWLKSLVAAIPSDGGMVIGQARFDIGAKPPFWQRLQALDFTSQEILSAGLATAGSPFNCSGASIAYTRKSFDLVKGWLGVEGFVSGDDELLMDKFVHAGIPVVAAAGSSAVVQTRPPASVKEVWRQRVRWGSKTLHYAWSKKLALTGVFMFYLALTLTPLLCFMGASFSTAVIAFGGKLVVDCALLATGGRLYGDRIQPFDFLIAELLHPPIIVAMAVAGAFGKVQWKD